MKKIILIVTALFTVVTLGAQTMNDALRFSETNYAGTARTLGMGNAFTALGGDLGSITLNPAGSAVASYSQVVLSPGLVMSVNTANGTLRDGESVPGSFGTTMRNKNTGVCLPNVGFVFNFDTYRSRGIKNVTLGFVSNMTNTWRDGMYAKGFNAESTFAGGLATMAYGLVNMRDTQYGYNQFYLEDWKYVLAYDTNIIREDAVDPKGYVGVTENVAGSGKISQAGAVNQVYGRNISGARYDMMFNAGMNISDIVYVGANLGIVMQKYSFKEYFIEDPEEADLFYSGFQGLKYDGEYSADGSGVYGKVGVIVTPFAGLRVGAAIQTPVMNTMKEKMGATASVVRKNVDDPSEGMATYKKETDIGTRKYKVISPWRFNVGAAWTFGSFGLVSADYEMCDYSKMMLKTGTADNSDFDLSNQEIRQYMTISHMLRAGVEIRPFSGFAVRAGYGLTTNPCKWEDRLISGFSMSQYKTKGNSHAVSFGLGYSTRRLMFFDIAVAAKKYADEYVIPYDTAVSYWDDNTNKNVVEVDGNNMPIIDDSLAPYIMNRKWTFTGALTIGLRF